MVEDCLATVIVTPRERYSRAREALESVAANTPGNHRFIYVAGGAPPEIDEYLTSACAAHGYRYIRQPHFLPPNAARNLGLALASTKYVVFLDNDVTVRAGWLDALIRCAEEEEADIVSPVVLMGDPPHEVFHSFGGCLVVERQDDKIRIRENHHSAPAMSPGSGARPVRLKSDYSEFHCALFRKSVFDRIGLFDERILGAAEHVDVALHLRETGGRGFAEPAAIVTYLPTEYLVGDLASYSQRWSEEWYTPTMDHLAAKWHFEANALLLSDYRSSFHELRERCLLPMKRPGAATPTKIDGVDVAQTIVQLLDQMKEIGYPENGLLKVQNTYFVAAELFAGSFRSSGRTFLAHLVGTGSIMAMFGASPAVISAAVLHAAYAQGRFPSGFDKDIGALRRWMRRRVGESVEKLVFLYSRLDLNDVATFVDGDMDRMPIQQANAILIRIANGIEDRVIGDHHYFSSSTWLRASNDLIETRLPAFEVVADRLGCRQLAGILAQAVEATKADLEPSPLRPSRPLNYFIDSRTGTTQSLPFRNVRELGGEDAFLVGDSDLVTLTQRRSISLSAIVPTNGGAVTPGNDGLDLQTDAQPWAYSAVLDLGGLRLSGPASVEIELQVQQGILGLLVLERGSSVLQLGSERSVEAGQAPATLKIEIPAMEEAGALVFRRWPNGDLPARAHISAVTVISASTSGIAPVGERLWSSLTNNGVVDLLKLIRRRVVDRLPT